MMPWIKFIRQYDKRHASNVIRHKVFFDASRLKSEMLASLPSSATQKRLGAQASLPAIHYGYWLSRNFAPFVST